jgi:uncharacterized protein YjiS (DUF1127 family)
MNALQTLWRRLRAGVHTIAERFARRRREARERRGFQALDRQALRDLGLDRSEFDSYIAESRGRVASTRRRLASASV